ncbi:MAG TPA: succinate dehydrogenase cytochrome b subunit [Anaerolineae bacterium]|nr:succinate dehydrogenase cytochrome b subunit [Anaerolineae bacterium]
MSVTNIGVLNLYRSSIGKKVIMAVTGLIGIGYVIMHMYGNLKVFDGAEHFNAYAEGLRELGAPIFGYSHLLWIARLVLLVAVVLHVWAAWSLYRESEKARSTKYVKHVKLQANPAALYIRVGGVMLLLFIILHLMHLTWGVPGVHPDFEAGNVYHNVVLGFQSYLPTLFYLVAMVALGFHMYHGTWSLFQTLGLNNQNYTLPLRLVSLILAIVVAGGFALVPLAVMFGIIS